MFHNRFSIGTQVGVGGAHRPQNWWLMRLKSSRVLSMDPKMQRRGNAMNTYSAGQLCLANLGGNLCLAMVLRLICWWWWWIGSRLNIPLSDDLMNREMLGAVVHGTQPSLLLSKRWKCPAFTVRAFVILIWKERNKLVSRINFWLTIKPTTTTHLYDW